jgi:hypothetical protein
VHKTKKLTNVSFFVLCTGWKRGKICEGTSKSKPSDQERAGGTFLPTLDERVSRIPAADERGAKTDQRQFFYLCTGQLPSLTTLDS